MRKGTLVVFAVFFLFGVSSVFAIPRIVNDNGGVINETGVSFHLNSTGFQYVRNNVELSMDKTGGFLIKVDQSYLRAMLNSNGDSGNIVIVSSVEDPIMIPYIIQSGSFVYDSTAFSQAVKEFYSSLNSSQLIRLNSVRQGALDMIKPLAESKSESMSPCDRAEVGAILSSFGCAFCPFSCVAAGWALYNEWETCQ
ncbi:MAG: hypothetical protein GXO69_05540 [Acidobacteria bacterium]|nr:hypothetical protein [Acidobacteriota bacterium]